MLKRLGPFINLMLAHYLLGFDSTLNFTTTGIYMSAAGCVIGALGDGINSRFTKFDLYFLADPMLIPDKRYRKPLLPVRVNGTGRARPKLLPN